MLRLLAFFALLCAVGCNDNAGPPNANETSATRREPVDRIEFVETYVKFRRKYDDLEYDTHYQNNGSGRVPGPSDWDVRIVAMIESKASDLHAELATAMPDEMIQQYQNELRRQVGEQDKDA